MAKPASSPKKPVVTTISYEDESVTSGYKDRPETYQGKKGRRDVIRLVTDPRSFYGGRVVWKNNPEKGFFAISHADPSDIEAGDIDAMKKACPLVRHGIKIGRRFVSGLYWIKSIDGKGRETDRNVFLPWVYGPDKFTQLRSIAQSLKPITLKDGTTRKRTLLDIDLILEVTEEQFNKMTIVSSIPPIHKKAELWELVSEHFEGDKPDPAECPVMQDCVEPDSLLDLEASIQRAEGRGDVEDDVDSEEVEDKPKTKPKAGTKPTTKKDADEEDDLSDLDASLGSDGEAEAEEDEKPKPKVKPKVKPKAEPEEEPEADADDEVVDDAEDEVVEEEEAEDEAPAPKPKVKIKPKAK